MDKLTVFPLKQFLVKDHCYHPKLEAKQIVNPQHNPDIKSGRRKNDQQVESSFSVAL